MPFFKIILSSFVLIVCIWMLGFAVFTSCVLVMTPQKPGQATDAIVVLTGGKDRIETGLDIFAHRGSQQLFITGVHEHVTRDAIIARWDGDKALPDCCVTLGYKATSTTENAEEARQWLADKDYKTIRLVTSNFHMPRALLEFQHALPGIKIIPNPLMQSDITPQDDYFWIVTFSEYNKTFFRFFGIFYQGLTT